MLLLYCVCIAYQFYPHTEDTSFNILYTGNRGSFLFNNDISVYISRDGGLTWNQVNTFKNA